MILSYFALTNQAIIVWTSKTKSLLPSLYKREEFPLFGKEGLGEISTAICLFNYGLLSEWEIARRPVFRGPDMRLQNPLPNGTSIIFPIPGWFDFR